MPDSPAQARTSPTHHRYATVNGRTLFYREAGPASAPTVVLLHGFPASSFMFRNLIPLLADRYHVIAPDHLGFGLSDAPPASTAGEFDYTCSPTTPATRRCTRGCTPTCARAAFRCSPSGGVTTRSSHPKGRSRSPATRPRPRSV
jgi:hypothetical protein